MHGETIVYQYLNRKPYHSDQHQAATKLRGYTTKLTWNQQHISNCLPRPKQTCNKVTIMHKLRSQNELGNVNKQRFTGIKTADFLSLAILPA